MMPSLPWPKTGAVLPFASSLLKGLAISAAATLCFSLLLSGLSRSTNLPPPTTPPNVRQIQFATVEPNKQLERKAVPLTPEQSSITTDAAKIIPATSAHQRPTLGATERATPLAARPVADVRVIHERKPAHRGVEFGYGLTATPPIDIRPAAQRIASNHSLDASFWQLATSGGTAISELAPRQKPLSQAIDTVRQRIASVINVLR